MRGASLVTGLINADHFILYADLIDLFEAECGGKIAVTDEWQSIESPGFPDPGYDPDQKCSWFFEAKEGKRIEFEFIEEFSFLCTSTCVDYVEMKIQADLRNTGFRWCCYAIPEGSFVSENHKAVIVFRSQLTNDVGFKLQARARTRDGPWLQRNPPDQALTGDIIVGFLIWPARLFAHES
ncbi:hypothetical protein Y032_0014g2360 [Ancylostoma ceylanicum]|uniref:CUB domain-containing protein n=1 Tax=Ancylostoma ceylanicum TaxID=53326 RepID=A0A016V9Q7_9BILA|nr:hypothetical protein Y032_0014g2360 [Ancylostoma ceylanicum]